MSTPSPPGGRGRAALGLAVAAVAVVAVGALLFQNYEVVAKDPVPGTDDTLYTIRLFDAVDVQALPEARPSLDLLNAYLLVVMSTVAGMTAMLLVAAGRPRGDRVVVFFAVTAAGLLFLSADEIMGIHESIGHNLDFLADLPGVDRADDVVVLLYAGTALVFLFVYRRLFLGVGSALRLFGGAVVLFALAAALDIAGLKALEEPVEILATTLAVAAFVAVAVHHLRDAGVVRPAVRAG